MESLGVMHGKGSVMSLMAQKKYKIKNYMFENISKLTYYNIISSTKNARIKRFIQCINKRQIEIITVAGWFF